MLSAAIVDDVLGRHREKRSQYVLMAVIILIRVEDVDSFR